MELLKKIINPGKTAVLVIDIQKDYCSPEGKIAEVRKFDMSPIEKIIGPLKNFLEKAREANVPIIFTRMIENTADMEENAQIKRVADGDTLEQCFPGPDGFEYYKIRPEKGDFEIIKKSYDAFSNEELEKILKKIRAENIILCGVYTSVCVDTTLRTAYTKGYNVIVPKYLVAMPKELWDQHEATLKIWDIIFAHLADSREIISVWNGRRGI